MDKFRKKPVVIEAVQFTGSNFDEMLDLDERIFALPREHAVVIPTLKGNMRACAGDWIIRGVKGEHYLCKDDIFKATYEPVV